MLEDAEAPSYDSWMPLHLAGVREAIIFNLRVPEKTLRALFIAETLVNFCCIIQHDTLKVTAILPSHALLRGNFCMNKQLP